MVRTGDDRGHPHRHIVSMHTSSVRTPAPFSRALAVAAAGLVLTAAAFSGAFADAPDTPPGGAKATSTGAAHHHGDDRPAVPRRP